MHVVGTVMKLERRSFQLHVGHTIWPTINDFLEIGADLEEDLEFHPLFDKFKKYSVQDDDVRVIQYHKLADCLRLIGIILVIDGHIEKLMAKYCPKYIPKEQQVY